MTYTIEKVTTLIGARRYGDNDTNIGFILTDSRSLCFPEETLFFALKSERNDGHNYIPELYRRGVKNFVVTNVPKGYASDYPGANFLKVVNTLEALQRLAERHRDEFNIPIVGITGSNGKTMVKEWLYQLLSPSMFVTRSPRSYNSQIGVPLSVWLMNEQTQVGVFEAGISMPGEMLALRDIIQPTIAVLTNLGAAHQENFSSMEEKCREKLILFHDAETVIYDGDDEVINKVIAEYPDYKGEKLFWSLKNAEAPFYVKNIEKQQSVTVITYIYKGEEDSFSIPFIDNASVQNAIISAVVASKLGLSAEDIDKRMTQLEPVAMRLEVKVGQHGCTLINDSYNSDINSLDIALDFMNRRPDHRGRRHTLILSDIYQSGQAPEALYKEVSDLARKRGVVKFIGIGPELCKQHDVIQISEKFFFPNVEEFIASEVFASLRDEVILLKGARQFGFDQLTELLVQKVHETTLEVNLNAVVANLNYYRAFMKPETKLVCMIKADGYGAGAVEIAKTLQDHRVDYLAVAVADEGVTLRKNGITSNIMIMNPEMTAFKTMFDYDLEPEVYSFRLLDALIKAAEKEGVTGFPVHIKLDTGMHLQAAFDHKILRHICNSAGIEHFPERQLDMCRLGLGLYGINSRNNKTINCVSTLKTTILQMHNVKAGDSVGYSRKTILDRDSVIAAIPIGYADGLNRRLGNRHAYCLVNGQKAEYVGNICMDVAMIDVTDIPCKEGDSVEIFGEHLPVQTLSDILETIPYEVLTTISNRVKRVYFQD